MAPAAAGLRADAAGLLDVRYGMTPARVHGDNLARKRQATEQRIRHATATHRGAPGQRRQRDGARAMTPRLRRLAIIVAGVATTGAATALVMNALDSNVAFFFTPTQVYAGDAPKARTFRVGGLVKQGSLSRDGLTSQFVITDTARDLTVRYTGILPDLFKEGKGAVAQGRLDDGGRFVATEVLAKHDENYMPPEAQHALDMAHQKRSAP
jgi:cytochrome c-type biogenesis protein CcmE